MTIPNIYYIKLAYNDEFVEIHYLYSELDNHIKWLSKIKNERRGRLIHREQDLNIYLPKLIYLFKNNYKILKCIKDIKSLMCYIEKHNL